MTWEEERRRKQEQTSFRKTQRRLARLDHPTEAEAAKSKLTSTASHYVLENRGVSAKQVADHLEVLLQQDAEMRLAADRLQADFLHLELRRIAREAVAQAPHLRRLLRSLQTRKLG